MPLTDTRSMVKKTEKHNFSSIFITFKTLARNLILGVTELISASSGGVQNSKKSLNFIAENCLGEHFS